MEVIYKKKLIKDLKEIPQNSQRAVRLVLDKLKIAESFETANVDYAKMEGQKPGQNYYRIRVGRYRIGVEYVNPDVIFVMIATRGSIYATFPPK